MSLSVWETGFAHSADRGFQPFEALVAAAFAAATALLGFAIGILLAMILNGVHRGGASAR
ncbi:MAG: hypothetical protein JSS00_04415 [Proteobacteria bacterium]|nr:hypothetical protein [Pseudomonadota bacterium]